MLPDRREEVARQARADAIPVVALAGHVMTGEDEEQLLALRFKLLDDKTFEFSWLAARAFQYRDRLQEAIEMKRLERRPEPLTETHRLAAARLGLACQALEQLGPSPEMVRGESLARLSMVNPLPPNEAIIKVETVGGRQLVAVMDALAIHAFISLVNRAEFGGLFDERNRL